MKTAILFLSVCVTPGLATAETRLDFDTTQTSVDFTLGDVLHTVHGNFKLEHSHLRFDPASGAVSGDVVVDAASGQSGSDGRDRRMHQNVLETMRFPDVVFSPSHFIGEFHAHEDSQLTVRGIFHLHGGDHEIDMPVKVHPQPGGYAFDTQFPVPYVMWGLKNPSTFLLKVGDTVNIKVHAAARTVPAP